MFTEKGAESGLDVASGTNMDYNSDKGERKIKGSTA